VQLFEYLAVDAKAFNCRNGDVTVSLPAGFPSGAVGFWLYRWLVHVVVIIFTATGKSSGKFLKTQAVR
jgi:hypothetical protein